MCSPTRLFGFGSSASAVQLRLLGFGDGLGQRVGFRHVPLAALLNAFLYAGLRIERVVEPGPEDYPRVLAVMARR